MLSALSAAVLGFLLGLKHATDADHVVAVTAIVAREKSFARAARVGAAWGLGHSMTVLLVGGALVGFRVAIPSRLGLGLEFLVALVLIGLGFSNLRKTDAAPAPTSADDRRAFTVGVVHGLAGSAAVVVLVLAAISDPVWAIAYLAVFGIGTVAGMTLVTALIAAPMQVVQRAREGPDAGTRVVRVQRGIRLAAGVLSIAMGVVLARTIIVEGGLFR
ncbi:MAG: high-affinity nickel-transport family protein [Gemmatimonadetes bacterium]|nr:high-affinity nickel-transport family protein [Gemmatimonadota bacterium]